MSGVKKMDAVERIELALGYSLVSLFFALAGYIIFIFWGMSWVTAGLFLVALVLLALEVYLLLKAVDILKMKRQGMKEVEKE